MLLVDDMISTCRCLATLLDCLLFVVFINYLIPSLKTTDPDNNNVSAAKLDKTSSVVGFLVTPAGGARLGFRNFSLDPCPYF